ncbi:MAG: hypothetical protein L6435_02480 [Anaerolineae bacterium]|nr:hypothetical protein [Anaerolineae bacterium]
MGGRREGLSPTSLAVLQMLAEGHSYEQVLIVHPDMTYSDIFAAAREALEVASAEASDYHERLSDIRREHPRAYEKWSTEEEQRLEQMVAAGQSTRDIASDLGRQPSAIQSRIKRLGLASTQ